MGLIHLEIFEKETVKYNGGGRGGCVISSTSPSFSNTHTLKADLI